MTAPLLTHFSHGAGCACKLRPAELAQVLASLPRLTDPRVLVGTDTSDDAAVIRLDAHTALVATVDFFAPVVDDPADFGRIAAANALSDVWAMGGRPLYSLSIVGFPRNDLPLSVLTKILKGGFEVAAEAGAPIVGGHSIDDKEPKFGLAVTGIVHPKKIRTNAGGKAGDVLVLTKPLGTGVVTTGIKRGLATRAEARQIVRLMRTLNREASLVLSPVCNALTDVTGFGLLGHLKNICSGSKLAAEVRADAVPVLDSARRLAGLDVFPGGTRANLAYYEKWARFTRAIDPVTRLLLADAQTNGGLLAAVPAGKVASVLRRLPGARAIGELRKGPVRIQVV